MRIRLLLMTIIFLSPLRNFACEPSLAGDETTHPMYINSQIGRILAVGALILCSGLLIIDYKKVNNKKFLLGYLFLGLIHPYWWLGVSGGDCGYMMKNASIVFTFLIFVIVIYKLIKNNFFLFRR